MTETLVVAILGLIIAPMVATVTWLLNRKKHVADIYGIITDSAQTSVETMQSAMETLNLELHNAQLKIEVLIDENKLVQTELRALRVQNDQLIKENSALTVKIQELMEMLTTP